jgi:putative heme-binding domain-containing protein
MDLRRIVNKSTTAIAGLFLFVSVSFSQQQKTRSPGDHRSSSNGQQVFATNCAGCHGLDGTGTQRAPNIVTTQQVQKRSAKEIHRIVSDGIADTGMPAFRRLGEPEITAVTSYLRILQGKNETSALPGNPQNGKTIFFAAEGCSGCHMIAGKGGFIAPDLSTYFQTHSADQIRSAITNPAERTAQQGLVTAVSTDGRRWEGIVRNEDNFSLQLQSTDGTFHFFSKADLKAIERAQGSMMPSDYGSKLSQTQLDDLVSYLLSVGKTAVSPQKHPDEGE